MAQENPNVMRDENVIRKLNYFLKLNEMLATGVGRNYAVMLRELYETMNKVYLFFSVEISNMVAEQGKNVLNFMTVKSMRMVKKAVIRVYTRMLEKCNDLNAQQAAHILETFIFPLGELLNDFKMCTPETKDQEFVSLFTVVL